MSTRKNTPFNLILIGFLLVLTLFAESPHFHGAWIYSSFDYKVTCHFYHANIFHLFANVLCLWIMRPGPLQIAYAFPLAVTSMFFTLDPTIGFSAVLYAYMGMNMFRWNVSPSDWIMFIVANIFTAFIPGVAFTVHLVSFILGFSVYYSHCQINRVLKVCQN